MSKIEKAFSFLGELVMTGIPGKTLSPETANFLKKENIGGVVLFSHNYENPDQLKKLCDDIQKTAYGLPLWIAVDQEGGRVQRFKEGFTLIPPALTVAEGKSPKVAFELAANTASELREVGINLNFAPVGDINTNPKNPVIGDRAFGSTEEEVSKFVTPYVRGHLQAGVQPCVKHFPGHGDTNVDSHFALPKVDTDAKTLRDREFRPFSKAFKSGCNLVMTAHVIVSSLDPKHPATLSKIILQNILRDELRFNGVIVSDDMEMKAIADHFGEDQAPVLAIEAGCDLVIYRSLPAAQIALLSLKKALSEGRLSPDRVIESAERIQSLKEDAL